MALRGGLVAAIAVAATLFMGGCGAKRGDADLTDDPSGLQDEALGSLARARAGTLGSASVPSGPLSDIYFGYDSFDLSDEARRDLQRHSEWLKSNVEARLEIEGHCDERGTLEYNLALGAKRAASTKAYLVSLGVSADRVTTISYGEELPLCHDPVESCWARNRRAHFVVIRN